MNLPESIKLIRETWRFTQEEMAELLGVSRARLMNYERGQNMPPIELLILLEEKTGITVRDIWYGSFEPGDVPLNPFEMLSEKQKLPEKPASTESGLVEAVKQLQEAVAALSLLMEGGENSTLLY